MRHSTKALMLVLAVLMAIPTVGFAGNGNGKGNSPGQDKQDARNSETSDVDECYWDDNGELAGTASFTGVTNLWPPNHKYTDGENVVTWALVDPDADTFEGEFTAGHDQMVDGEEMNGAGNTDSDISPASGLFGNVDEEDGVDTTKREQSQDFLIRAERSGRDKDGRVYTISGPWVITDGEGRTATCSFEFYSYVPHDQGNKNNGGAPGQDDPVGGSADAGSVEAQLLASF